MTNTILINKEHRIKNNYLKKVDLVKTKNIDNEEILIEKETLENFLNLKESLKKEDIEIGISSAYRSIERQQELLDQYLKQYGQDYCDEYVAPPGGSEHHTGLAVDFYIKGEDDFPVNDPDTYKDLSLYKKVHKVLKDYGFILRYPENKKNITGYAYEPWHIRYVGKFVATIIYENDLTLEEYLTDYNGLIAVNKKKGMTSFDVVSAISKLFGIKKVGHTGTLDPLAEGVLIVAIGKATKVVELVTASNKEYEAEAILGIKTDTLDITGKVIKEEKNIDTTNLEEIINSFQKTYLQEVPIYSAVKVDGKKLYEYARKNESVELPKREVTIEKIKLLEHSNKEFKIKVVVSKGTYIRSLIDDIGKELGCYATMKSLIRTEQANINIEETYTLKDIAENNFKLLSIEYVLDYPVEVVDKSLEKKIKAGQRIKKKDYNFTYQDKVIFISQEGKLLGIYDSDQEDLKVWKNFV